MLKRIFSWSLALGIIIGVGSPAFADDNMSAVINELKLRVVALEKKLEAQDSDINLHRLTIQAQQEKIGKYESQMSIFEEKISQEKGELFSPMSGIEIEVGGTMVIQGADNINYADDAQAKESRTDGSYSADVAFSKEFEDIGGTAFLHLEAGQGSGLTDNLILYSNVNRDAGDSASTVELTEFWYEQGLLDEKAFLTFGKLDATAYFDQNEAANDETTQFLGDIFRNSPVIEFPDNGAGVQVSYLPLEWMELGYGVFDGNGSWEDVGDNLFNMGQINFKTNIFNLPGNYRFYGWNNNSDHSEWLDSKKTKESAYGFGLSFDQKIHDFVTLFTRYGWQNPEVYNPEITACR